MSSSKAYQIAALALVAGLLCSCGEDRMEHARELMKDGQIAVAERVLVEEQKDRPGDLEVRMLLGEVYVKRRKVELAAAMFEVFLTMPKYAPRVAAIYESEIAGTQADLDVFANYALQTARFDPARAANSCNSLLTETRRRRHDEAWELLATTASQVSEDCRSKTRAMLTTWMLREGDQRSRVAAMARELTAR